MDTYYFKNLERYNKGEKQADPNILIRLGQKIDRTLSHIRLNEVIDYVIYDGKYIVKLDTQVTFHGTEIPSHLTIEVIRL